jgi:hypothetical protein
MTSRRPLVVVAGQARQLPAGDTIAADAIVSAIPRGTSFPVSPTQYDLYHRTDLGIIGEWDGTRWLGPRQDVGMGVWTAGSPWSVAAVSHALPINFACALTFSLLFFNNGTNNASNYWSFALMRDASTISTLTTAAYVTATNYTISDASTYILSSGTLLQLSITKTGSPGSIRVSPMVFYRRIYT